MTRFNRTVPPPPRPPHLRPPTLPLDDPPAAPPTDETTVVDVDLNEPLLTAAQVADLLGIPRSSVYEYARRTTHPLPSLRVGRHRRFYRSDVEVWLSEQRG